MRIRTYTNQPDDDYYEDLTDFLDDNETYGYIADDYD